MKSIVLDSFGQIRLQVTAQGSRLPELLPKVLGTIGGGDLDAHKICFKEILL
jgi:hypothetical protein